MSPFNSMENEKKRLRNQFTKDERLRLLNIMTEYGPLLDDKNISILSRKEIWEIIEQKFNDGGHSGRSSAQLKKYWQNYKYHSKRAKIAQQDEPERDELNEVRKNMVRMLADVHAKKWSEYRDLANKSRPKNSPEPTNDSTKQLKRESFANVNSNKNVKKCDGSAMESMLTVLATPSPKTSNEAAESNIIVSRTNGPGNSVTVSVICPEIASKARSLFWKKASPVKPKADLVIRDDETNKDNQSKESRGFSQPENVQRLNIVGMFAVNNTERGNSNGKNDSKFPKLPDQSLNISRPCRKASFHGPFAIQSTIRTDLLGGVLDSVGTKQLVPANGEKSSTTLKRKETENLDTQRIRPKLLALDVAKMRQAALSVDNASTRSDDFDMKRIIVELANLDARSLGDVLREAKQVQRTLGTDKENGDWLQNFSAPMSNEQRIGLIRYLDSKNRILTTHTSRRGLITLKDLLRPLASADDSERRKFVDMLRKFVPKDATADDKQRNAVDECLENGHDRPEVNANTEKKRSDGWFDGSMENGRILVKDLTSLTSHERESREIKAEPEESETESTENPSNTDSEDRTTTTMMDHLVQAKFHCVKSGLDHQIELQKLEMEEKRLRIKIAEMTFQETKLRIQALNEERFRAKELHDLRLAQMTVEKVRADTEYVIRMNSTEIDDRGRIASIEGDRKQREDFHPLQLKSLENNGSNNSNDGSTVTNSFPQHR